MADAIHIEGVRKTFGTKVAVDRLDLRVPEGGLYGLIGPNGAGKTTTIRMVMSILFPDSGSIRVLGKKSALESKDRIGYLPEERGVYRKMRVGAFLRHMGRLKGMPGHGLDTKVKGWLDRVGLADCHRKKCEELSKGMQQKVQVIAALLHEPELVILDEPFSGLDPVNTRMLRDLILEQHRAGRTMVFSTHVMHQAEQLCDHIVMIDNGRKVLDDTLPDIRARHDPRTIVFDPANGSDASELRTIQGIRGVVKTEQGFEASLAEGADPTQAMRLIVQAMPVTRIELRRPTLEDVFIEIVRSGGSGGPDEEQLRAALRDGAAGAGGRA
jgi:ABC-2 type transport system ATP-binding protein